MALRANLDTQEIIFFAQGNDRELDDVFEMGTTANFYGGNCRDYGRIYGRPYGGSSPTARQCY
jgi:hypothetical protein